jgi:hypothetical protein
LADAILRRPTTVTKHLTIVFFSVYFWQYGKYDDKYGKVRVAELAGGRVASCPGVGTCKSPCGDGAASSVSAHCLYYFIILF